MAPQQATATEAPTEPAGTQPEAELGKGPGTPTESAVVETQDQQDGVRVAEAVTKSWSKKSLIIAYAS
jgi:hypothetical protein